MNANTSELTLNGNGLKSLDKKTKKKKSVIKNKQRKTNIQLCAIDKRYI